MEIRRLFLSILLSSLKRFFFFVVVVVGYVVVIVDFDVDVVVVDFVVVMASPRHEKLISVGSDERERKLTRCRTEKNSPATGTI